MPTKIKPLWLTPATQDTDWKEVVRALAAVGLSESRVIKSVIGDRGEIEYLDAGPSSYSLKLTEEQYQWLRENLPGSLT